MGFFGESFVVVELVITFSLPRVFIGAILVSCCGLADVFFCVCDQTLVASLTLCLLAGLIGRTLDWVDLVGVACAGGQALVGCLILVSLLEAFIGVGFGFVVGSCICGQTLVVVDASFPQAPLLLNVCGVLVCRLGRACGFCLAISPQTPDVPCTGATVATGRIRFFFFSFGFLGLLGCCGC